MVEALWFDSGWPPALADLTGRYAGYVFYLAPGDNRRPDPTKAQLDAYLAAGLDLAMLWQAGKVDIAAGGFNLGVAHARAANVDADLKGAGAWEPILYACDANRAFADVEQYYRGVLSVPGRPVGAYGSGNLIDALYDRLGLRYFMQAGARAWNTPVGYVSPLAQFWQRDPNVPVGNSAVDQIVQLAPYPTRRNPPMATYPDLTADAEFVQCARVTAGSNLPPTRVVIHATVSKTQVGGARATANGFALPTAQGSAHYIVDPGTVVQSGKESQICWHAPPNGRSIGIEMTDLCIWQSYPTANAGQMDARFAGNPGAFAARWSRPEWQQMLARTALVTRYLCDKYGLPITRLSPADLKAGKKGICGHRDVSLAFGQSSHIDPYASTTAIGDFPWDQFLDLVRNPDKAVAILGGPTPGNTTDPVQEDDMTKDELHAELVAFAYGPDMKAALHQALVEFAYGPDLKAKLDEADDAVMAKLDTLTGKAPDSAPDTAPDAKQAPQPATRAVTGVPNEDTSPGVHGAFDTESLEG